MKRTVRVPSETRLQPSPIAPPETNVERLHKSSRHPARTEKGPPAAVLTDYQAEKHQQRRDACREVESGAAVQRVFRGSR